MWVGLLSLALLRTAVPAGFPAELALPPVSSLRLPISRIRGSPETILIRPVAEDADGERECSDDNDNSDESSEFAGSMSRHALSLFRTRLQHTAGTPHGISLPLFYAFCTLLI